MPKAKTPKKRENNVAGVVAYYADKYGENKETIYERAGLTRSTMYTRLKNPDSFRLYEIKHLAEVLQISLAMLLFGSVQEDVELKGETI